MKSRHRLASATLVLGLITAAVASSGLPLVDECAYTCNAVDGNVDVVGAVPGVLVTLTPKDSEPGGTDTIPACDNCRPCKQEVDWEVISTGGNDTYTVIITDQDLGFSGTRGTGNASGTATLKPNCGNAESIEIDINRDDTVIPPAIPLRVSYIFSCDC